MKILIAGSGKMGSDLFNTLSPFGFEIVWLCVNALEADRVRTTFEKRLSRQLRAGLLDQATADALLNRVIITADAAATGPVDLVIEAIWEDAGAKSDFFRQIEETIGHQALLASNTSSIPLSRIFSGLKHPERGCGLHFFYPIQLHDLVEVNLPAGFSQADQMRLLRFLDQIKRFPLVLREPEHFLMNRLLLPFQAEAVALLNEGKASAASIDALVRDHLFPIGPFEFFDHVGLDVMAASVAHYAAAYPEGRGCEALLVHLQQRVTEGRLGLKNARGYYAYPLASGYFKDQLPDTESGTSILRRLESAWYGAIEACRQRQVLSDADLDRALAEYWGETESFLQRGRGKGYLK